MKLLLGSKEYLRAVDKDYQISIDLKNEANLYQSTEINKIIDEL